MAGEWRPFRLGDVCTKIGSGATPRGGSDVYLASGPYALIRSQNVYNDGFHHDGLAFIGERHASELANVEVLEGDVLLNITGDSVARACQVDPRVLPARVNQHVAIIRPDPEKLDPRFLRYFLVSREMQMKLLSWAGSGGTRNALTKGMIESFDVRAPKDIDEQRAVAHILGTLDDKIELNQRMSETLESMGRALFKLWFVDFDPVGAKAEGRDAGLASSIADLFPSRFADSEAGNIPEGWIAGTVGRFSTPLSGGTPSKNDSTLWGQDIPWITPKGMTSVHVDDADEYVTARALGNGTRLAPKGATLVMVRGMGLHQKVRVSQARRDVAFNQDVKALVPRGIDATLLLFALLDAQDALLQRVESSGHGTGRLPTDLLMAHPVTMPQGPLRERLSAVFCSINDRIALAKEESRTLAALRDALLPKLISGELRVNDAVKSMASAF